MTLYPKLILDALATVTYAGTKKNLVESGMVADTPSIDGMKVKVVGQENAVWIAMDYTDVMVHVFVPDTREYYDIEHLWEDAPKTLVPNEES